MDRQPDKTRCLVSGLFPQLFPKFAKVADLLEMNKVIRKIRSESIDHKYYHVGQSSSLKLLIFSDASLGNLPDGGSQGGFYIPLTGEI